MQHEHALVEKKVNILSVLLV